MAINRASIAKQLLPGLNAVFGVEYGEVNDEHTPLFETENSDRSFEEEVLFTGFGTAPVKTEGAAVSFDVSVGYYIDPLWSDQDPLWPAQDHRCSIQGLLWSSHLLC